MALYHCSPPVCALSYVRIVDVWLIRFYLTACPMCIMINHTAGEIKLGWRVKKYLNAIARRKRNINPIINKILGKKTIRSVVLHIYDKTLILKILLPYTRIHTWISAW